MNPKKEIETNKEKVQFKSSESGVPPSVNINLNPDLSKGSDIKSVTCDGGRVICLPVGGGGLDLASLFEFGIGSLWSLVRYGITYNYDSGHRSAVGCVCPLWSNNSHSRY